MAELALAFVMRIKSLELESQVIHTDDTSIKMLELGSGLTRTCKFWPYRGDWLHPYAAYDFTFTRKRDGPQNFLRVSKVTYKLTVTLAKTAFTQVTK